MYLNQCCWNEKHEYKKKSVWNYSAAKTSVDSVGLAATNFSNFSDDGAMSCKNEYK